MLSVTYESLSIPLFWTVTGEKGCSDDAERKAILQKFLDEFGAESIRFVTRERRILFKRVALIFDKEENFVSVTNQGKLSNHECQRRTYQSL